MSARALLAAATVAAGLALPVAPAAACDPNTFPYCTTYCRAIAGWYEGVGQMVDPSPPPFPRTGLAGCP